MATIKIDADLCKSCGLCLGACPRGLIVMEAEAINAKGFHPAAASPENADKCTGCAFCAIMCPDCAIEVYR